jgi:hypothetical protein
MDQNESATYPQLTRFFVPLAIQAISQALTHPLVAMVASRGPGGPLNLAGLAQSSMVVFFLGIFAIYYMTTGMVYAKTREAYQIFWRVCVWSGLGAISIQALLSLPGPSYFLFSQFISLPPSIAKPAQITLLASIPVQFLFFLRIPYQVLMYNGRATGRASLATLIRIFLTAALAPIFCYVKLVGPVWAVVCLSIPVLIEVLMSYVLARPFLKQIQSSSDTPPRPSKIFFFNLPLSIGGYFLVVSALILSAFIARSPEPERILPVYFLVLGLANPVSFAATRIQAVVLAFPPLFSEDQRTVRFALMAGIILGFLPLMFILPELIDFYYVKLQRLPVTDLGLVRVTAVALVFFPISVAIRAQREGLAAWQKKPRAVLIGHGCFMLTIIVAGYISMMIHIPGYLIGSVGLTMGSLVSSIAIRIALKWAAEKPIPVGQTTTSMGQIR